MGVGSKVRGVLMSGETKERMKYDEVASTVIKKASKLPLVKVNREEFLRKEFGDSPYIEKIIKDGPQTVFSVDSLEKKANQIIKGSTKKTTVNSFLAGLPSNAAVAIASAGIDITQYYGFAINLAQKISYIYGARDFGNITTDEAEADITILLGVMLGVDSARIALGKRMAGAGVAIGKRVAAMPLTKTLWYPVLKRILKKIGIDITKKTVEKTIANSFSIAGAAISGGITWASFRPLGRRLSNVYVDILNGKYDVEMELDEAFKEALSEDKTRDESEAVDVEFEEIKHSDDEPERELDCTDEEQEIFKRICLICEDADLDSEMLELVRKSDKYVTVCLLADDEHGSKDIARIKFKRAKWIGIPSVGKVQIEHPEEIEQYAEAIRNVYKSS